jgi:Holliday junction resolvase RusA-like endonuclease
MYLTPKARKYKQEFFEQVRPQLQKEVFTSDVKVKAICTFGTKRKKDISNCLKIELDALNNIVYKDDSQIVELLIIKEYKKGEPSLVLEITGESDETRS